VNLLEAAPETVLRRIEWTVLRRLAGELHGDYRSLLRGLGVDLADLREYQFHDDVRHIDWNVTARLQVPYVRDYFEDREITAWILLDLSGSMDFGSGERTKRMLAIELATLIASMLMRHGNRVGIMLYRNQVEQVLPARHGRIHLLNMIRSAQNCLMQPSKATDLEAFIRRANASIRRRCAVFVISDFVAQSGWESALGSMTQRHDVTALRLSDPLEEAMPDLGYMMMRDAETGESLWVDTHDAGFRRRFRQLALKRRELVETALERAMVDTLEISTEDDPVDALLVFAQLRKARSRSGAGGYAGAFAGAELAGGLNRQQEVRSGK
jgi:uncharacterized protein (DUF58 family)